MAIKEIEIVVCTYVVDFFGFTQGITHVNELETRGYVSRDELDVYIKIQSILIVTMYKIVSF